jgi:hypothetical protein
MRRSSITATLRLTSSHFRREVILNLTTKCREDTSGKGHLQRHQKFGCARMIIKPLDYSKIG